MIEEIKQTEILFDVREESKISEIVPLINEPYTYENMVNNPIIKHISETDRSLRDLDDMLFKKLIDIRRLQQRVNNVISDVPQYQDSPFISDLIKLAQNGDDVIKLLNIQLSATKDCIRKVADDVKSRYGVRLEDKEEYVIPETIIPEGSIIGYLDKLMQSRNEMIVEIASKVKEIFIKIEKGKDDKDKFKNAVVEYYSTLTDRSLKQLTAKISRMEEVI